MNYQGIVLRIIDLASERLNEWESDFINDIFAKNNYENLTLKQQNMIRKIQNKYLKF